MPLLIDNKVWSKPVSSVSDFLEENKQFKETAKEFHSLPSCDIPGRGLLYINQREFAVVKPDDANIQTIATDSATTCHMVVLRHSGSGATCLAHCDGCDTSRGLSNMVATVRCLSTGAPEGRLEVSLVGGFVDPKKESRKLSVEILKWLMKSTEELHLMLACITDNNNVLRNGVNFPVVYGIGVEVRSGRVFPATMSHRGPDLDVRSACHFAGVKDMFNVYDCERGELVYGPYSWEAWDEAGQWAALPDSVIRKYLSTSPDQEPAGFEDSVRRALRVLDKHPRPERTLFPDGRAKRYRPDGSGGWESVS